MSYRQLREEAQALDVDYPQDFLGNRIYSGDIVIKAISLGRSPALEFRKVVRVEGKFVWVKDIDLKGKEAKIRFNDRLLVL